MACLVLLYFLGGESLLFAFHTRDTSLDKFDLEHSFAILFILCEIEDLQHPILENNLKIVFEFIGFFLGFRFTK